MTYFEPEKERRQVLRQAIFESGVWHQTDKGELSLKDVCEGVQTQLDASYHSALRISFYHWYEVVHVYSGLQERIRLWSDQGYRIYILSTTCEIFYHIEKAGFVAHLPTAVGYILPQRSCRQARSRDLPQAVEKYGLDPVESVFIDDIQANLDTAAELGFETILSTSETENIRAMETLLAAKGKFD